MADVYYTLDIVPHDLDRVRGALTQSRLEVVGVSHFRADAQRVVRYAEAAKIDGSEDFVFLFPCARRCTSSSAGGQAPCRRVG